LFKYTGRDSSEICKYLIQKCPESVRRSSDDEELPIHILQDSCGYRFEREIIVCLLREYPESYHVLSGNMLSANQRNPGSYPIIMSIKALLDEEKELKETAVSLTDNTSSLTKAVACTNDDLMRSAFTIFGSWSTSIINTTEDKLQLISTQLQEMCDEGRESDE